MQVRLKPESSLLLSPIPSIIMAIKCVLNNQAYYITISRGWVSMKKKVVLGSETPPQPSFYWEITAAANWFDAKYADFMQTPDGMVEPEVPRRKTDVHVVEKASSIITTTDATYQLLYSRLKTIVADMGATDIVDV